MRKFFVIFFAAVPLFALDKEQDLSRYGRQTWQTESGLPQNTVHAILQTHDGYIWLATEGGLVRFDGVKFQVYDSQNTPKLRSNNIRCLLEDRENALWIGTADGLTRFDGSQFSTYTTDEGLPSNSIWSIYQGPSGPLSVSTSGGSAEYRRQARFQASNTQSIGAVGTYQDREGATWVSTDPGLARIVNHKVERFPGNDPLSSSIVLSIYEDREGSLWLGTDSAGVTVLRDQKFTTYTDKEGLSDNLVRCVFQDRNGVVWVGTSAGLNRFANHRISKLTTKEGLSSDIILALAEDSDGNLLVGTPDGLNVLRGGRVTIVTSADGLADDFVRSIYGDLDGSIWIGTRRGLSHWEKGRFKTYTQADGLGSDFVGALLRDSHQNLWIGTLQGLTRFNNGQFRNYATRDGLSSNVITALYEDSDGVLWIGTEDGGLNRFASEKVFHYPAALGLPGAVYGILEDSSGNFWMTSKTGIFRVSKKDLNAFAGSPSRSVAFASYGTADGLRVSECTGGGHPTTWKSKDGSLWFSTLRGVATINPERSVSNRLPPPVVLESVSVDDQLLVPGQATDLSPGHSRFSFEYSGLSFITPQNVKFKYKLEGFDKSWIDAETRRVAYYTNIPPGRYRFRVLARNSDGVWNESGASFAFRLRPHFYQTYWFDFLLLAAVALLCYEVYRYRVKQVESQFKAVLAERNRIAREIHDTLAQGFVAVSVQLELIARVLSSSTESAQKLLKEARALVQNSLADARRSIWELRSQSEDNEDLASQLSKIAARVTSSTPLKVEFQVLGTYRSLPQKTQNELLRIGQEAVANVVRHAEAKHVQIDLKFDARKLRMTIADDGRGFAGQANSAGPNGHFGLKGMRERAEQINAELTVTSAPGQGTQVCVETVIDE
ncbi:MAG: two-component regulator propeller domain-containing protein [Bryobacteraceae bacterium]